MKALQVALHEAAQAYWRYADTKFLDHKQELRQELYALLESIVGKPAEKWTDSDKENIDEAARAIAVVFDIGVVVEEPRRKTMVWWQIGGK